MRPTQHRRPRTCSALNRRSFLKVAATGALGIGGIPRMSAAPASPRPVGANGDVRIAVVGMGDAEIGIGGRGRQLIGSLQKVPGVRLVAFCDVDQRFLDREARPMADRGIPVTRYTDLRRLLDDKSVDAVVLTVPDHWHALATLWACQAGKDVFVEKPVSHDLWEGKQMVAAATRYDRIVQAGMEGRSSRTVREVIDFLRGGSLGPIRFAHVLIYRQRDSIGKVTGPTPIPREVDYNLWCGPVTPGPLMRKELHYDWHWVWPTGTGEMGNNSVHHLDICRWAMRQDQPAPRVMSLGGRFGYDDDGETPNTHLAVLDYPGAPIYCEVRGLSAKPGSQSMGEHRGVAQGYLIQCEGGYIAGAHTSAAAFDNNGKTIRTFDKIDWGEMDEGHLSNFAEAVRNRRPADLHAAIHEGDVSAANCHLINLSYRLGKKERPDAVQERIRGDKVLEDAWQRYDAHLRAHGISSEHGRDVLGPWVTYDARSGLFTGEYAVEANKLRKRIGRPPFNLPELEADAAG